MRNIKKSLTAVILISPLLIITACNKTKAKYEDLSTGEKVYIIKDKDSGVAIDSLTSKPVLFYVNLETRDTLDGKTGLVVNNMLLKSEDGTYAIDESKMENDKMSIPSGDVKIKVDGDEMKIKTDEKKIKIDGNEKKVKYNN